MTEVQFDLIGTYWGMDKKSIYIGAYTGEKKAGNFAEKVIFGGSTNEPAGKAHVDLADGKIYAQGFVTSSPMTEEDTMTDPEAEDLVQVSEESKELDLGRSTKYLHRKVESRLRPLANWSSSLRKCAR